MTTDKRKVLVVDDEKEIAELLKEYLQFEGYSVVTAENGLEAISVIKKDNIDLVISDAIMPNMGGFALAKQMSEDYPEIPIFLISGYSDILDDEGNTCSEFQKKLLDGMLSKPFNQSQLQERIHQYL